MKKKNDMHSDLFIYWLVERPKESTTQWLGRGRKRNSNSITLVQQIVRIRRLKNDIFEFCWYHIDSEIVELKLESMLPDVDSLENYYRYSGSLTTPPCTEGVIWNLFTSHINISSFQVGYFFNFLKLNTFKTLSSLITSKFVFSPTFY